MAADSSELPQAWIVASVTGEHEDREETILKVFLSEASAKDFADRFNVALKEAGVFYRPPSAEIRSVYVTDATAEGAALIARFGPISYTGMQAYVWGPFEVEP